MTPPQRHGQICPRPCKVDERAGVGIAGLIPLSGPEIGYVDHTLARDQALEG
jgi:hypothetical protein